MALSKTRKMKTGSKTVKAVVKKTSKPTLTKKVATLQRTVKKLNKVSYDRVQMIMQGEADVSIVQPYYQWHLQRQMNNWTAVFGSTNTDIAECNKAYINSYKVDARIVQSNEPDRIFYSMFIVSLKDQGADSTTFDPLTGQLTLADSTHYQTLGSNGRVLLNPKFFNIHAYKRFTMGGTSATSQGVLETKDISFTIKPRQRLVENPRGNVFRNASFAFPKDPSQNYYVLLFNDDSGADLQTNKIYVNGLASVAIPN